MLRSVFFVLCLTFFSSAALAGQGIFLTINNYLPGITLNNFKSNCLANTNKINLNQTVYLESESSVGCMLDSNPAFVQFDIQLGAEIIATYKINVAVMGSDAPSTVISKDTYSIVSLL